MRGFFERLALALPWIFIIWFIAQTLSGDVDGLLAFVLVVILVPLAAMINLVTVIGFRGYEVMKVFRGAQQRGKQQSKTLESTNYAELPWWNPKRWFR